MICGRGGGGVCGVRTYNQCAVYDEDEQQQQQQQQQCECVSV